MKENIILSFIVAAISLYSCDGNTRKESTINLVNQSDNKEADNNKGLVHDTIISVIGCPGIGDSHEPKVSTNGVWSLVDQMPQFPGGDEAIMNYIKNNLKYPKIAIKDSIQGQVIIRFVVSKDGSVKDIQVLRSLKPSCDKEAVRIIKSMPKWIPGKQKGKEVDVYYTLPVRFRLKDATTKQKK